MKGKTTSKENKNLLTKQRVSTAIPRHKRKKTNNNTKNNTNKNNTKNKREIKFCTINLLKINKYLTNIFQRRHQQKPTTRVTQ